MLGLTFSVSSNYRKICAVFGAAAAKKVNKDLGPYSFGLHFEQLRCLLETTFVSRLLLDLRTNVGTQFYSSNYNAKKSMKPEKDAIA